MALALHVPKILGEAYHVETTMVMATGLQDPRKENSFHDCSVAHIACTLAEGLKDSLLTFHTEGYKAIRWPHDVTNLVLQAYLSFWTKSQNPYNSTRRDAFGFQGAHPKPQGSKNVSHSPGTKKT